MYPALFEGVFTFIFSNAPLTKANTVYTANVSIFPEYRHGSRRRGVGAAHSGAEDAPRYDHARLW